MSAAAELDDDNPAWFQARCRYAHPVVALRGGRDGGGGRGLFARRAVRAGTTLLVEPHLALGAGSAARARPTPAARLRGLLLAPAGAPAAAALRLALTVLHPTSLECVGAADRAAVEAECRAECALLEREVSEAAAGDEGAGESALESNAHAYLRAAAAEPDCMLRLMLTMRFNSFQSGLYFALAMVNHACRPNCAKFGPDAQRSRNADCSELVAIRDVLPDEELCISYLEPVEQARCVRVAVLHHQHFFAPEAPGPFAPACEAMDSVLEGVALEREVREIGDDIADLEQSPKKRMRREGFEGNIASVVERLEATTGPEHMYRTRLARFIVRYCDVKLARASDVDEERNLVLRQVRSARQVLDGMRKFWGKEAASTHHEVATMHEVCAQGIEHSLASGDKAFQNDMFAVIGVANFSAASKEESVHRKRFRAITLLYAPA